MMHLCGKKFALWKFFITIFVLLHITFVIATDTQDDGNESMIITTEITINRAIEIGKLSFYMRFHYG